MTNIQESTQEQVKTHVLEIGTWVLIRNSRYQEVWGNVVELTYFRRTGELAYGVLADSDISLDEEKEQVFYRLPRQILKFQQ